MLPSLAIVAAVAVASVSAISIITPNSGQGWTNDGSNTITWSSVSTDKANFTIILENLNTTTAPQPQQLDALVNTADGHVTVNPPSEGWPAVGGNYIIKFVADTEDLDTQLVQSQPFSINAPAVSSGSVTPTLPPSTPVAPISPSDSGASGTSSGSAAPSVTGASAALPAMGVHTGLVGALVLLSALLTQL
ncbi:hypothetical protein B0H12DRAFT_1135037 [Mycena haematopus]|nr:hypothetical protein B0H12DRAFT_1135037 [Mycena haematopus]